DGNVVKSLKKIYGYLRFYLLHYKVMIWVSFSLGFVIGFFGNDSNIFENIDSTRGLIWLIVIVLILVGIVGSILQWLVNMIYGKKIKRLKRTIEDLSSEE
ncbi:MAG: hypothetical protein AAFY41_06690, partial [Bacteroidota bacterium]